MASVERAVRAPVTTLSLAVTIFILSGLPAAEAQQPAKVPRIGYLGSTVLSPQNHAAFIHGLRDLGYVEGRNVVIEYRDSQGKYDRLPGLAAELVALKVDVIVVTSTPSTLAAKQATKAIPIVFTWAADPVGSGLVTSLARPGGNVTGLSLLAPELVGKRVELLKQVVPGASRIAALWHPGDYGEGVEKEMLREAGVAARALGMRLQVVEARGPEDFDKAFSDMTRAHTDAVTVQSTNIFFLERARLTDVAS